MLLLYWKWIALALIISGIGGYMYYNQYTIKLLREENVVLEVNMAEKAAAVAMLERSKARETKALAAVLDENRKVNEELDRYLEIFDKHNLNKLARAKPGLIERRVNAGTKKVFEEMENETSTTID